MGILVQLFSLEELKSLDLKEIEILKDVIRKELRTSPAVSNAIRANVRAVFQNLKAPKPGEPPLIPTSLPPAPRLLLAHCLVAALPPGDEFPGAPRPETRWRLPSSSRRSTRTARAIRPVLEAFVRVAYPEHFPAGSLLTFSGSLPAAARHAAADSERAGHRRAGRRAGIRQPVPPRHKPRLGAGRHQRRRAQEF